MQKPSAIKGPAGTATAYNGAMADLRTKQRAGTATQVGDTLWQVQGSGAKPYTVDLEGGDRINKNGKTTKKRSPKCSCPNWAITRNRLAGPNGEAYYECKHIKAVLDVADDINAKEMSKEEAQRAADEILATFVRKPKS